MHNSISSLQISINETPFSYEEKSKTVKWVNESLWRSFGEDDFPSVCVLVTHGLMTRVFLMKW